MKSNRIGGGWRGTSHGIPVDPAMVQKLVSRISDADADKLLTAVLGDEWVAVRDAEISPAAKAAREIFGNILRPRVR